MTRPDQPPVTITDVLDALDTRYDTARETYGYSRDGYDMGRADAYDDAHTLIHEWANRLAAIAATARGGDPDAPPTP